MYPSAVLLGRTMSDVVRNAISFAVMLGRGVPRSASASRARSSDAVGGDAAAVRCSRTRSAGSRRYTGLVAGSAEAVNSIAFLWMFVATFISSAFVAPENMPSWLQPIAEHNPFTIVTDASRALYNGRDPGSDPWDRDGVGHRDHRRVRDAVGAEVPLDHQPLIRSTGAVRVRSVLSLAPPPFRHYRTSRLRS